MLPLYIREKGRGIAIGILKTIQVKDDGIDFQALLLIVFLICVRGTIIP